MWLHISLRERLSSHANRLKRALIRGSQEDVSLDVVCLTARDRGELIEGGIHRRPNPGLARAGQCTIPVKLQGHIDDVVVIVTYLGPAPEAWGFHKMVHPYALKAPIRA